MKRILVTGAAGFIGFHVAKRLLEQGHEIVGFDNLNDYYDVELKKARVALLSKTPNFRFVQSDLCEEKSLMDLFGECSFDDVIHLAAQAGVRYSIENPKAYIQSNLIGFFNVLEAVRAYPVQHFVYASSSSVYGYNKTTPLSTDQKTDSPVSLYAATKKADELLAYSYSNLFGIKATGLRFFTVYGPWGRPDMAYFSFTKKILSGEPISLFNNGEMLRDFTYIDDIVEGIIRVLEQPPLPDENGVCHAVYNIGNHNPVPLLDFVRTLEEVVGKKALIKYLPMQPGDVYQTYADVTPLMERFGYKPSTELKEGLTQFYKWFDHYYGKGK